jgi:hypothetical protein
LLILLSLAALLAHALLLLGYLRHLLRLSELSSALERWAWAIYSLGLLLLLIVYFFLGFWTQPALKEVSWAGWSGGVAALGLAGILWFLNTRQPRVPRRLVMAILRIFSLNWLYSLIGLLYRSLRYLVDWITLILEGDGGILWAILLLALILSLIARQGLGG